jgi:hypothetical protein
MWRWRPHEPLTDRHPLRSRRHALHDLQRAGRFLRLLDALHLRLELRDREGVSKSEVRVLSERRSGMPVMRS